MSYGLLYIPNQTIRYPKTEKESRFFYLALISVFLTGFTLLHPLFASGQSNSVIRGKVVDATTARPLNLANISVIGTTSGAVSGIGGNYEIITKASGRLTLKCSYVGYRTVENKITLKTGDTLEVNFYLEPVLLPLSQIVVGSGEPSEYTSGINQVRVNNHFLSRVPAVGQKDIFRVIELLPGVKTLSDFSTGLYVRGSKPDETLVRFNQIPVYNPGHFYGFYSIFNPDVIGEVRLFKNPYPAGFGGRIGSLLSLRSKGITNKSSVGSVSLGLLSADASWIGRVGRNASLVLGARRSTLEPVLAGLRTHYQDIPDKFYFWDGTAIFDWGFSRKDHIKVTSYLDNDFFSNRYLYDRRDELAYGNAGVAINEIHSLSPNAVLNLTFVGSWYHNEPTSYSAGTEYRRRNVVSDEFGKMELQVEAPVGNQITLGGKTGNYLIRLSDKIQQQNILDSRRTALHGSFWLQDTWQPVESWSVTLGLRNNWFKNIRNTAWAPRGSISWRPVPQLRFEVSAGRYYQYLSMATNAVYTGFDAWLMVPQQVKPELSDQVSAGVRLQTNTQWSISLEGYNKRMDRLFELNPFLPDLGGMSYRNWFWFGNGYARGMELTVEKKVGHITGFLGYTLSLARVRFPEVNEGRYYPPRFDRTHDLTSVLSYHASKQWTISTVFQYATGQPYTLPLGQTPEYDTPFRSYWRKILTIGRVNASRLPAYSRLDFSATRKGTFLGRMPAELSLQIINAYARRNVWYYKFNLNGSSYSIERVKSLPIVPSVSYTIHF